MTPEEAQNAIIQACDELKKMLLEKNDLYGNSAFQPSRVFSRASALEQLYVRADDKVSRLRNLSTSDTEDSITDLTGYLILIRAARILALQGLL